LLTVRGVPQIYSGDEIGMPGGNDPDNRRDFPGGFPGDARNAFQADGRTPEQQEVFEHFQKMLKLRAEHKALRRGKLFHLLADDTGFAFVRDYAGSNAGLTGDKRESLLMVMNNSDSPRSFHLDLRDTPIESAIQSARVLADSDATLKDGVLDVTVPARKLVIYSVECGCDAQ